MAMLIVKTRPNFLAPACLLAASSATEQDNYAASGNPASGDYSPDAGGAIAIASTCNGHPFAGVDDYRASSRLTRGSTNDLKIPYSRFGTLALLLLALCGVLLAAVPGARAAIALNEALDTVGVLSWSTTNFSTAWTGQTNVTHDGVDAAVSATLGNNANSMFQTFVTGPGAISYWWKVSSETNNDRLVFHLNLTEQARISGEVDWQSRTFSVPAGNHSLRWSYVKNSSVSAGQDQAWMDQVVFTPSTNLSCTFTRAPGEMSHSYFATTGVVNVLAEPGCAWTAGSTNGWITILSGARGVGTGSVVYAITANPNTSPRDGSFAVAGQVFTINQDAAPAASPPFIQGQPVSRTVSDGSTVNFHVLADGATPLSYQWFFNNTPLANGSNIIGALTTNLTLFNVQLSQAGNYRVLITNSVGALYSSNAMLTVTDHCAVAFSPPLIYHGSEAGGGYIHVSVAAGCTNWGVINTNPWISYIIGATEFESYVSYAVTANNTASWRTGILVIAEQIFTAVQNPSRSCSFTFSPESASYGAGAVTGAVAVAATLADGCNWFPSTTNRWITILSGFTNSGNGTVTYALAPNDEPFARSGGIRVAHQFFPISQAGTTGDTNPPTCVLSISPAHRAHSSAGATNTVALITQNGCPWSVATSNSWITILSSVNNSNSGPVAYSLAPNTNSQARSGSINIGGQRFFLIQFGITNAPRLEVMSQTQTNTTLALEGNEGKMYVLESSDDLIHWTPISTNSAPSAVTDATADARRRFYRTVEIP